MIGTQATTWTNVDPYLYGHMTPLCPNELTRRGQMTHICVRKLTNIGSDDGLSPGRCQAIIWTSTANIVYWTLRNKLQWNLNRNSYIFIQENAFENVVHLISASMCQLNKPDSIDEREKRMSHLCTVLGRVSPRFRGLRFAADLRHMIQITHSLVSLLLAVLRNMFSCLLHTKW